MTDHFIVIHRWSDSYADYAAYVDHGTPWTGLAWR